MSFILQKEDASMAEKLIEVKNLSKVYNLYDRPQDRFIEALWMGRKNLHKEKFALKDISFDVKKGESVGIIGTNGSGKSTLLKILTGVLHPTSGSASVKGKVSALLELGAGFNPEYTGIENIFLNGRMMKFSREEMEDKMDDILSFADIGEYVHQPVKTYSSGMFARLAFAVAINVDAEILIVDEALSVGDIFFQNKCFRKFDELKEKGVTILFVSHDIESIRKMTSRVLWIEQGSQMLYGDKVSVCNAYSKSLLLKNNKMASEEVGSENYYGTRKFELSRYPGILKNNENLLNDKVIIRACFFEDSAGNVEYDIISGQDYKLVVLFESREELKECIVGYVIQNKKGQSIINSNTMITGEHRNFYAGKDRMNRVEFCMTFPQLYSDEYIIDCAVANGKSVMDNEMKTWCYGALKIMVHNEEVCLAMTNVSAKVNIYEAVLKE